MRNQSQLVEVVYPSSKDLNGRTNQLRQFGSREGWSRGLLHIQDQERVPRCLIEELAIENLEPAAAAEQQKLGTAPKFNCLTRWFAHTLDVRVYCRWLHESSRIKRQIRRGSL